MHITTVTQKGQVTIPVGIRQKLGLKAGDAVQFFHLKGKVALKPMPNFFSFRGSIKSRKKFDVKAIERAAEKQAVKEYLHRVTRTKV